jgi:hypothetical protein
MHCRRPVLDVGSALMRPPLHPHDIATATGDRAAAGLRAPAADPSPPPTWGLLAVFFALWIGSGLLFLSSLPVTK